MINQAFNQNIIKIIKNKKLTIEGKSTTKI